MLITGTCITQIVKVPCANGLKAWGSTESHTLPEAANGIMGTLTHQASACLPLCVCVTVSQPLSFSLCSSASQHLCLSSTSSALVFSRVLLFALFAFTALVLSICICVLSHLTTALCLDLILCVHLLALTCVALYAFCLLAFRVRSSTLFKATAVQSNSSVEN